MPTLPREIVDLMSPFAPVFTKPTWAKAQLLWLGAILAPGKRTVTSALRVLGMEGAQDFSRYHQVLNRARWSSDVLGRTLLQLIVDRLCKRDEPLLFGIDETIERRRGKQILAKGIYRDGVRSSDSHFVKAMGLRWISLMCLCQVPWSQRCWALPVMTGLAPSRRYYEARGRQAVSLTERAAGMLILLHRWLPGRELVVLADRGYAALDLLALSQKLGITFITRLRLDAALYTPAPPRKPGQMGRPRKKGGPSAEPLRTTG